jgi:hypothetical protein
MDNLVDIVQREMSAYAVDGENGYAYLTRNLEANVLTVIYLWEEDNKTEIDTGLFVRLVANRVYIMRDQNDKPLVDALVQAGIPREQIVLAYAGETVEETA